MTLRNENNIADLYFLSNICVTECDVDLSLRTSGRRFLFFSYNGLPSVFLLCSIDKIVIQLIL